MEDDETLHHRHWKFPCVNDLQDVFVKARTILDIPEMVACLFEYINPCLLALKAAGQDDSVTIEMAKEREQANYLKCPGCGVLMKKQLRNCQNAACKVKNVRAEIRKEAGIYAH